MAQVKKRFNNGFAEYAGKKIRERMEELGMTQYRFCTDNNDIATFQTLRNIRRGEGGTNISTLAEYCDRLGLEIIIRPKES